MLVFLVVGNHTILAATFPILPTLSTANETTNQLGYLLFIYSVFTTKSQEIERK